MEQNPEFKIYRELPANLAEKALERAINAFLDEEGAGVGVDRQGAFNQALKTIILALNGNGDLWLSIGEDGEVNAYTLASVDGGFDDGTAYYIYQGWIHPRYRHTTGHSWGWELFEEHARSIGCKHLCNITSRDPRAYLKALGPAWHRYTTILKKDLS